MELICPKCNGAMRTYERNGVHVDQCLECRGIFLDRGELERLVDAENSWHAPSGAPPAGQQQPQGQSSQLGAVIGEVMQQARTQKQSRRTEHYGGYPHRKKKSFLDELFG